MYSFPSTSQIRAPSPRATKNGALPTLRNARTGEFTPPGIRFCARAKNSEECDVTCRGACAKRLCIYARRLIQAPRQRYCPLSQKRRGSQVVRSRSAKPLFAGSIPAPACLIASAHLPERQERQAEFLSKEKSVTRLLTRSGNALHWLYRSNETREQSEKAPVTQAKPPASRG